MRRLLVILAASFGLAGLLLVLPVSSPPRPEPVPVKTTSEAVAMGSVATPAPDVEIQQGTTVPVAGVPEDEPVMTLTRTDTGGFSLVGVTWAYDPAVTDTVVQVRVQDDDGEWGEWTQVGTEGLEQAGAAGESRGGTSPLWTGPSTGVEAELVTRTGAEPTDVRIDLVDPGTSAADTALGEAEIRDTADAAMAMPPVYSRAQWGADPALRTWSPEFAPTLKAATVHHTADSNNYGAGDVPAIMRSIYTYHARSLGWGDIGYNVIVDKFGRLWEGRDGGLASTVIGAHAAGFNSGTFGVSMLGNYDTVNTTQPMVDAVSAIIAWKFSLYGIDPKGSVTLTSAGKTGTSRYEKGAQVTLPTVFAHRDVGSTACPGRYGFARMGEIRTQAYDRTIAAMTPIERRYAADAGLRAGLGAPVGTEQAKDGVSWQVYANGRLYSSQGGGVRVVRGAILDKYLALGGPAALGAPTADDAGTSDGRGAFVRFQGGDIYWSPASSTHVVRGSILTTWLARGGATGHMGFPTTSDAPTPDGRGYFTRFQGGDIYYSPSTGTQTVVGSILGTWLQSGGSAGPLGFPATTDALTADRKGAFVRFQGGDVYWSPASGTQIVRGSILTTWLARGGATGHMGFPTTSDAPTPDGRGYFTRFQGGDIYYSPSTGTQTVVGSILTTWLQAGGSGGVLGFPTTTDALTSDRKGAFVRFQGGDVYWSPATGTHIVRGALAGAYVSRGGPTGSLGFPTRTTYAVPEGLRSDFERGSLTWNASTSAITQRS
ncbi:N-acetylmuramoyl-L-alanine amidase [Blastococcus atacamensis]|uniref:N-acetylmuramoyl-L-alanine amidase n=1 Tax=Blastococcus atacamensis TaxID=2070508 RepID=UPI001E3DA7AB|nr:N-acetylmuramoyl-L-alanine amidase [Blastococcus atacamensis]